jgi:hypothetical protein
LSEIPNGTILHGLLFVSPCRCVFRK